VAVPLVTDTAVINVALVEDQPRTRDGLAALIAASPRYRMVGAFESMEAALRGLDGTGVDVILSDIGLPGLSGVEGLPRLKAQHPGAHIVMLTVYDDSDHIFEAICAGASGYLLKDTPPERLLDALAEAHAGGAPLTPAIARKVIEMFRRVPAPRDEQRELSPRELDVLRLLADGHSYKTAADVLGLGMDTIRYHVRHIYEKLHVHSKSEAVLKAFRSGLLR
jgi:DNA-binding NarL/FixJ family response regulator